jgi:hypothetical protein
LHRFPCEGDRIPANNLGRIFMEFRRLHGRVLIRRVEQEAKTTRDHHSRRRSRTDGSRCHRRVFEAKTASCAPSTSNPATACCSANGRARRLGLGEELMIMKESDIMAIVEGGGAAAKTS